MNKSDFYLQFVDDEFFFKNILERDFVQTNYLNFKDVRNLALPRICRISIVSDFKKVCRDAENDLRLQEGIPLIGQGWVSETELFNKISALFTNEDVIQHASPDWLGRQHLDIYFPKFNIGIEYQGRQHFEPIDFFGGQETFEKNIERDERKKRLCLENDCKLIYTEKGYNINVIEKEIRRLIIGRNEN